MGGWFFQQFEQFVGADGVIFREGSKVNIDYDFCKGCGICSKICKPGAIKMEAEK